MYDSLSWSGWSVGCGERVVNGELYDVVQRLRMAAGSTVVRRVLLIGWGV